MATTDNHSHLQILHNGIKLDYNNERVFEVTPVGQIQSMYVDTRAIGWSGAFVNGAHNVNVYKFGRLRTMVIEPTGIYPTQASTLHADLGTTLFWRDLPTANQTWPAIVSDGSTAVLGTVTYTAIDHLLTIGVGATCAAFTGTTAQAPSSGGFTSPIVISWMAAL